MNDPLLYILKVSLGLLIISIPYYFLLRNDPNLVLKRFYLVLGLIISWVFPLIVFRRPDVMLNLTPTVFIDPGATEIPAIELTGNSSQTNITINWIRVALSIYVSGLVFMFLKNLWIISRWNITCSQILAMFITVTSRGLFNHWQLNMDCRIMYNPDLLKLWGNTPGC